MAVQAQLFPENLGYILPPSMCGGVQDWTTINPVPATAAAAAAAFGSDPPQQQPLFGGHHLQQSNQNFGFDCNIKGFSSSSSSTSTGGCGCGGGGGGNIFFSSMAMSRSLDSQLELQRQEIDYILQIQSERLRSVLQEQRKKQLIVMLKSLESKAVNLMRQKEEDLFQARNKTMELEACLREAEIESETWQRLARENEAMVVDLSNTLQQVRERLVLVSNTAEDAESSFCGSCDDDHHKQEQQQQQQQEMMMIACKRCNSRGSCVLFLPCRHLCSCKHCEPFLVSCPVCKSAKEASMEVFWV